MTLHRGKIARTPTVTNVRALTRDDLMVLNQDGSNQTIRAGVGVVTRLREPHHRVARLFAAGLRTHEVAERSGYSSARVTTLKNDPAFQELVAKYRDKVDAAFEREQDVYMQLATQNMITAERMIAEKLEEHEENGTLPAIREALSISRDAADRFGYGKRQTNLNINADFASMLEKARARSAGAKTIEGTQTPTLPGVGSVALPSPQSSARPEVPAIEASPVHPSQPLILRRA